MRHLQGILAALAVWILPTTAQAVVIDVDAKLSLVIDVSLSIDAGEYTQQMNGYGAAFRDAVVQNNILTGTHGRIGVNAIFFSTNVIDTVLDDAFLILDSTASIDAFATTLEIGDFTGDGADDVAVGYVGERVEVLGSPDLRSHEKLFPCGGGGVISLAADDLTPGVNAAMDLAIGGESVGRMLNQGDGFD